MLFSLAVIEVLLKLYLDLLIEFINDKPLVMHFNHRSARNRFCLLAWRLWCREASPHLGTLCISSESRYEICWPRVFLQTPTACVLAGNCNYHCYRYLCCGCMWDAPGWLPCQGYRAMDLHAPPEPCGVPEAWPETFRWVFGLKAVTREYWYCNGFVETTDSGSGGSDGLLCKCA